MRMTRLIVVFGIVLGLAISMSAVRAQQGGRNGKVLVLPNGPL